MPSDTFKDKDVIIHPAPVEPKPFVYRSWEVKALDLAVRIWTPERRLQGNLEYDGKFCAIGILEYAYTGGKLNFEYLYLVTNAAKRRWLAHHLMGMSRSSIIRKNDGGAYAIGRIIARLFTFGLVDFYDGGKAQDKLHQHMKDRLEHFKAIERKKYGV